MTFRSFWKEQPRVVDKRTAKREEQSTLRSVYKQVDQRDKVCRCCGCKELLEHHHLIPRSRGGQHSLSNILRLCRQCHRLCQTHWIWVEGDDCNKPLVFMMSRKVAEALFSHRAIPTQVRIEKGTS